MTARARRPKVTADERRIGISVRLIILVIIRHSDRIIQITDTGAQ